MGVGHVKIIPQRVPASFRVKHRNALAVLIYPPLKEPVPCADFGNGGGVWALGVDEKLLVKAALVIAAGRR
ncbi:hypothetical protein NB459_17585 [Clostridioides difficile]|uniref:hypothetical protein n=1 Tax=Clostridioides difficile TaxID=1496 RepID=UPI00202FD611|nr:hypothetical protein [Clostridioides difficile]MCM0747132.1 hypothetical protein [Clostridioides difficile]